MPRKRKLEIYSIYINGRFYKHEDGTITRTILFVARTDKGWVKHFELITSSDVFIIADHVVKNLETFLDKYFIVKFICQPECFEIDWTEVYDKGQALWEDENGIPFKDREEELIKKLQ